MSTNSFYRYRSRRASMFAAAVIIPLVLGSCTKTADEAEPAAAPQARPAGPSADVSEELAGGRGPYIAAASPGALEPSYVEHEFVAEGTASSYRAAGGLTGDGRWTFEPELRAGYRTRVLVRQPENPADFSGVVIVEWLNVSGGADNDPDYVMTHEGIARHGDIWVGVSAQAIGVEGGPVLVKVEAPGAEAAGKGLTGIDPARYGSLSHPGDAFSFDIYSQVARALRQGGAVLDGLEPTQLIAMGESQSAGALVTYINGVQPLTHAFDGFFVHSRAGSGLPLVALGQIADMAGSLVGKPTILRTDTDVPVFEFQSEGDLTSVLGSIKERQPDTEMFRLWEVAGTSHADTRLVGAGVSSMNCGVPINDGPQHVVAKAALRHLIAWVGSGEPPPEAPRLEVTEGPDPQTRRDAAGIALGGVRTPPVDVPVRVLSSVKGPVDSVICLLVGSTAPLPPEQMSQLYTSRADYESRYAAATDRAIDAGYVLEEERVALDEYAHTELVPE